MKFLLLFPLFFCLCVTKKTIDFETVELLYLNPKYGTGTLSSNRYNATTFLINADINITKDIPTDAMLAFDIFKLSDNTYKKTALSMKRKLCQFIEAEFKMMKSSYMEENFDVTKGCPLTAGHYTAKDIDPIRLTEGNEFFTFLPLWALKLEIAITSQNEAIVNMRARFKVMNVY